ncbi:MAG: right-handed parallel beta-helix repeat-containing protein [Chitinophagales bacterium]|nr:right-handed parallel beta-helix repeat-containing protein [Chitinophagales bacterium]
MKQLFIILLCAFSRLTICAQALPALPNTSAIETCLPDTSGYTVLTVGPIGRDFSDLQMALDAAQPGALLLLDAGVVFKGSFTLPDKTGTGWIILAPARMDLLPAQGLRLQPLEATGDQLYPTRQDAMPKIMTTHPAGLPCFRTAASAHRYRLLGLEICADTSVLNSYGLIFLGDASAAQSTMDVVPEDIIIDRCYIHGHDKATIMKGGVILNCSRAAVIDSYISGFHSIGYDTYAIAGTNGPGPFIIRNNYLEAAGENILFGGAAPAIPGLVPSDIEVRNNYFFKPFSWRPGHPDYAGKHWTVKNLFELKTGRRVLLDGNLLENCWADLPIGQSGYAILLTVRAEGGASPQADVSDVTISNNIVRHAGAGISLSGHDSPTPSLQSRRIRIANNLFDDISGPDYGDGNVTGPNDGTFLKIGDPADVLLEHNTILQSGAITWAYDTTMGIAFRDNLVQCFVSDGGYQSMYGPGFAHGGNGPMGRYFPGITDANQQFHKNALIGGDPARYSNYNTLSQNYFPANPGAVQFLDYSGGSQDYHGYRLSPGSPYAHAATDGRDLGVDFMQLDSALHTQSTCTSSVSVSSPASGMSVRLFPSPFQEQLTLESIPPLHQATLILRDLQGREIQRFEGLEGGSIPLRMSRASAGMLFWEIVGVGRGMVVKHP